jgi:hypothetical protein
LDAPYHINSTTTILGRWGIVLGKLYPYICPALICVWFGAIRRIGTQRPTVDFWRDAPTLGVPMSKAVTSVNSSAYICPALICVWFGAIRRIGAQRPTLDLWRDAPTLGVPMSKAVTSVSPSSMIAIRLRDC